MESSCFSLPADVTHPDQQNAIEEFYQGEATFYSAQHVQARVTPLLSWGGLFFALVFIMLCFNVLFKAVGGK